MFPHLNVVLRTLLLSVWLYSSLLSVPPAAVWLTAQLISNRFESCPQECSSTTYPRRRMIQWMAYKCFDWLQLAASDRKIAGVSTCHTYNFSVQIEEIKSWLNCQLYRWATEPPLPEFHSNQIRSFWLIVIRKINTCKFGKLSNKILVNENVAEEEEATNIISQLCHTVNIFRI